MLKIKKIKPLFTSVLVTGDRYEEDMVEKGVIVASKGDLKLYQTVLAVGTSVRDINVGDKIMFDPRGYAVKKYSANSIQNDMDNNKTIRWDFPWVYMADEDGKVKERLLLKDRDIEFVFEGEEEKNSKIIVDDKKILLN